MDNKIKLTKKEYIAVDGLISYYDSLDLDVYDKNKSTDEKDTLSGLSKLMSFYDKAIIQKKTNKK